LIFIEIVSAWSRAIKPDNWNKFASDCGGSFINSWAVLRLTRFLNRVLIIRFYCGRSTDQLFIGQCAVSVTREKITFLDRLLLLPEHTDAWADCMDAVIKAFGTRLYCYGSHWNEEPERDLPRSPLYTVEKTWSREFHVDAVDFSQWEDFSHYRRSISSNIRRDFTKAVNSGQAVVQIRRGWAALRDLRAVIGVRRHVMAKNSKYLVSLDDAVSHTAKIVAFGRAASIATALFKNQKTALIFCIEFGDRLYYLSGGVLPNDTGQGSLAMLTVMEKWQSRYPRGRFVMGYATGQDRPEEYTHGALLYRRKLRVTARPGLEYNFMATFGNRESKQ
jgi:hypothetical protein